VCARVVDQRVLKDPADAVASGPSSVFTPAGSWELILERYSSTRVRAQYMSVPSSKMT
jgi:hypothetical protein